MDIKDRNSDFREADRKYAELARKRDAGDISAEEFDAERKRLMVLDKQGRWWAKSSSTGEWNYHDGKAWVKGVPPGYEPQSDAAPAKEIPERRTQPERTQAPSSEGQAREVADEGGRSRVLRWNPILLLALLLFILIGGTTYALTRGTSEPGGDIAVPDLVGASSIEEARSIVGGDFEIVEADGVESQEPIGAVVDQDPAPGESVGEGSTISVNVSKGVDVPDIEGERRDEAAQVLEDAGFEVEEETEESSEEDEGLVTGQDPRGGEFVEADSTVTITVGEGPDETDSGGDEPPDPEPDPVSPGPEQIPVPDVIGESVEEAEQTLEDAGFATDIETVESDQSAGTVVWTDPAAGTLLDPSSREVIVGQSSGPPEVDGQDPVPPESPGEDQYIPPEEFN